MLANPRRNSNHQISSLEMARKGPHPSNFGADGGQPGPCPTATRRHRQPNSSLCAAASGCNDGGLGWLCMARWRPRIRNGPPDIPSNPRRLTTDPCNKVTRRESRSPTAKCCAGRLGSRRRAGLRTALKISRRKRLCSRMPPSDILLDRDRGRLALAARRCQRFMIRRSIYELQGPAGRARFQRGIARAY